MNSEIIKLISTDTLLDITSIKNVLTLLSEDKTVAFIARYRKDVTNGMTEDQIRNVFEKYTYITNFFKKKEDIIRILKEKDLLTNELLLKINSCKKLVELDDLYRPYKEKKKTKASYAISLGLLPLANTILTICKDKNITKEEVLKKYITNDYTYDFCIEQALYIVADLISDNANIRKIIREKAQLYGYIKSSLKDKDKDQDEKFKNYYDTKELIKYIKAHRLLAINRGANLDILKVDIELEDNRYIDYIINFYTYKKNLLFEEEIKKAVIDSYKRLIIPSIKREIYNTILEDAKKESIEIFATNLKHMLLQPCLRKKVILGVDPAYKTGCKLAVISHTGAFLEKGVIYPNELSEHDKNAYKRYEESKEKIKYLVNKYNVDVIAIGNGTASRETEEFISRVIKDCNLSCMYAIVSEAGASIYSASKLAKDEFPNLEVQERSAISIARRVLDPLSELIKIDPKSIGVGQYQHDVCQKDLSSRLSEVVSDVVNKVGVNVNSASIELLSHISGLNKASAKEIILYRDKIGGIKSREEIKNIKRITENVYNMCIGFLRVDGSNLLDLTQIHPESYDIVLKLLNYLNLSVSDIGNDLLKNKLNNIDKNSLLGILNTDIYTLNDIIDCLKEPKKDIRDEFSSLKLRSDVLKLTDLKEGMKISGTIRNVCDFGLFVDCGVKYYGLCHKSKIKNLSTNIYNKYCVGDIIDFYVCEIDYKNNKYQLEIL